MCTSHNLLQWFLLAFKPSGSHSLCTCKLARKYTPASSRQGSVMSVLCWTSHKKTPAASERDLTPHILAGASFPTTGLRAARSTAAIGTALAALACINRPRALYEHLEHTARVQRTGDGYQHMQACSDAHRKCSRWHMHRTGEGPYCLAPTGKGWRPRQRAKSTAGAKARKTHQQMSTNDNI